MTLPFEQVDLNDNAVSLPLESVPTQCTVAANDPTIQAPVSIVAGAIGKQLKTAKFSVSQGHTRQIGRDFVCIVEARFPQLAILLCL
jgi:hypothetical protein